MLPTSVPTQHSPKRSPNRKILRERNQSQANKLPQPLITAEAKQEPYPSTPYPTKPAHVLLPSSTRCRDGRSSPLAAFFAARSAKDKRKIAGDENSLEIPGAVDAKAVGIKRSVSELRDLYESQATRPSTGYSTNLSSRPLTTISSPALRGQLLGERLSPKGRFLMSESDEDERIGLPSPRDTSLSIKKISSEASLPPPPPAPPDPSPANLDSLNSSSSVGNGPSADSPSPNLVALGSSSSVPEGPTRNSSSPNFVSLGHSSSQDFESEPPISSPYITPLRLSTSPTRKPFSSSFPDAPQREQSSSPRCESSADSSPNLFVLGSSSPNYITTKYNDSQDVSPGSLQTIKERRSELLQEQHSASTLFTPPEHFSSSPPNRLKSTTSASTLELPPTPEKEHKFLARQQKGRLQAHEDLQNAIESSPAPEIQYPVVMAPRMNQWEDLSVPKRPPRLLHQDPPPARWNPHLSTVPSEWSDENRLSSFHTLDTADTSDTQSIPEIPQPVCTRDQNLAASTTNILPEADRREATDIVSDLRGPFLHNKTSGFLSLFSASSRSDSIGSIVLRRPNSSSSLNSTARFPAWAHRYYSRGPSDSFYCLRPETSSSNFSYASHPSTAVTPAAGLATYGLFRPRTRASKNPRESHLLPGIGPLVSNPSQPRLSSLALDPADPRSHWAGAEQAAMQAELRSQATVGSHLADEWSPHLFPDNRASGRNTWLAPSIDDRGAPIFTWRNAHMVGFMLGFILPISWFVAALLPLPPPPAMKEITHDPEGGGPTLQEQLDYRTAITDEIRYANLRWWRNLNRFMCAVGLVVVAIIVGLRLLKCDKAEV